MFLATPSDKKRIWQNRNIDLAFAASMLMRSSSTDTTNVHTVSVCHAWTLLLEAI
jgi:hypothetical protein